jgi:hypothetical protein
MNQMLLRSRTLALTVAALLMLIFLSSPSLVVSSFASAPVPLAITTEKSSMAGYEIFSSNPGSFVKVQGTWAIPSVTCPSAVPGAFMQFYVVVGHISAEDAGSQLVASCSGLTPQYLLQYINGASVNSLPAGDTISAGDKMQTIASVAVLGGETAVSINDLTKGWTFGVSGSEAIDTTSAVRVLWFLAEPGGGTVSRSLLSFSALKTSGDSAIVNSHTGTLGSFVPLAKFTVFKWVFIDPSNNHVLARPTSITSTSTGFSLKFVQGS